MRLRGEVSPSPSSSWPRWRQVFANIRSSPAVAHEQDGDVAEHGGPLP